MDVKKIFADAWVVVEGAGLPEHVQPVAFEQAVRLLTGGTTPAPASFTPPAGATGTVKHENRGANGEPAKSSDAETSSGSIVDEDGFFATFADESGIDAATLRSIYFISNGQVRLSLSRRVLGASLAKKNRTVAMLTLGARHYVNGDMALKITDVREAIKPHGYDPTRNLSKHLDDIAGTQAVGAKNDKAVRVQNGKFDAPFKELIERLTAN